MLDAFASPCGASGTLESQLLAEARAPDIAEWITDTRRHALEV